VDTQVRPQPAIAVELNVEPRTGEVRIGGFPLGQQPLDYQLTIHINNLIQTYNPTLIIKLFKEKLYNPEMLNEPLHGIRIRQVIVFYGVERCRQWFTNVYGWDFNDTNS